MDQRQQNVISFSDLSSASSIDQEQAPSILLSAPSINDSASLADVAEVDDAIKDRSGFADDDDDGADHLLPLQASSSSAQSLRTENENAVLVAMLRAYFKERRPGVVDDDFFDLLGQSLTSPSSSELMLDVDADRVNRFLATLSQEAPAFVAFSAATAEAWKRSLFPSLIASYEVPYSEERFRLELDSLATEIKSSLVDAKEELEANRQALAEKVALVEGLLAELLDEELTENAALTEEQFLLEKAVKQEKIRIEQEEAQAGSKANIGGPAQPVETLKEKLSRLTRENARLIAEKDHLVKVKEVVDELDPALVARYKAACQSLKFTTDIFNKH